jgi:hypothetical protein
VGFDTSGRGEKVEKECKRVNMGKYCVHMYINGKMIPVETVPGMGRREIKENGEGDEFKYDIFDIL